MNIYKFLVIQYIDGTALFFSAFKSYTDVLKDFRNVTLHGEGDRATISDIRWVKTKEDENNDCFYFDIDTLEKVTKEQTILKPNTYYKAEIR